MPAEVGAERQAVSVFERLDEFVEGKVVLVGGQRRVEVRRLGQAMTAQSMARRRQRAAGAGRLTQARQIRGTDGTQDVVRVRGATEQAVLRDVHQPLREVEHHGGRGNPVLR